MPADAPAVHIRPYRKADADATLDVFRAAVHGLAAAHYDERQRAAWAPDDLDAVAWAVRRADADTVVAEVGDRVAGFSDVDRDGYIDMLFVHPDFARRGVASALLRSVLERAREGGATVASANVSLTARPAFEKAGFSVQATERVERNGVLLDRFRMSRPL